MWYNSYVKRVRRWLYNAISAISIILFVATIADRVAQRWYCQWFEVLTWHTDGPNRIIRSLGITTGNGFVIFHASELCSEASGNPPNGHIGYGLEQLTRTPSAMPFCPVRFGDESIFDGFA